MLVEVEEVGVDQGLHVKSGVADSPDRKEKETSVPLGAVPSHRNVPNRLVRPVSLTAETYSPERGPPEMR
jgi:hypothetical protein